MTHDDITNFRKHLVDRCVDLEKEFENKDIDWAFIDGSSATEKIKTAVNRIGVRLYDDNGVIRPFDDVILDVAVVMDKIAMENDNNA